MSPKTVQPYELKYLHSEEEENLARPRNSFIIHLHVKFVIMEAVRLSKNINYVPDYFSGLSCALLYLFPTTFLEKAVFF